MKKLMAQQRGMTFIGLVLVLAFIAIVVLFVLKAFPLYNEQLQVRSALNTIAKQVDAPKYRESDVHKAFLRSISATTNLDRFSKNNIKDFLVLERGESSRDPKVMRLSYEAANNLAMGLKLVLVIDETVPLTGGTTGD